MTISYNWLNEYLPEKIEPAKLSEILTSIGLEVENLSKYESIKGGLKGLIIGEIFESAPHPNADKLKLTKVDVGNKNILQIVCGAPNVAANQKVIVATIGTTIHPISGEPVTMKEAKIRGEKSEGMICAEDEIGISNNHSEIIVLPDEVKIGEPAANYFKPYLDWIYEIGLTPNRVDAMSHYGVAKDVCAYLSHRQKKEIKPKNIFTDNFKIDNNNLFINVKIENTKACPRYSAITISDIEIDSSPQWIKDRLIAINQRSINNIVDITNYILHETGQPLHAFDADKIKGKTVVVKNLPEGTSFTTLDEKQRKLSKNDLMICDEEKGMCIAGVFGGLNSGVNELTKNIFLESAWFNPEDIRKTALYHGLRTEAATRFEKGVDISNTVNVLKRAALMIKEITGGKISSEIIDVYPQPKEKKEIVLKYDYLKKLSGKNYDPDVVKNILVSLEFEIIQKDKNEIKVLVPFAKSDINLPADLVEEIIRIDGLNNIEIPTSITISPQIETLGFKESLKEKISDHLTGIGFHEIITNSITNSKYYSEKTLEHSVRLLNNLSADLDVLRPFMLETGLEIIAYNINRKNTMVRFFEFGKTYNKKNSVDYLEDEHLSLYISGNDQEDEWRIKSKPQDFYTAKGITAAMLAACGFQQINFLTSENEFHIFVGNNNKKFIGKLIEVAAERLHQFDIKQPVYFIDIYFASLLQLAENKKIIYEEVAKFPFVQRDISIIVNSNINYATVISAIEELKLAKLKSIRLFDIFESEKLGSAKKSLAINLCFLDEDKTLTDKETDSMMNKIIQNLEQKLSADIRK
ncbi:MAG: phenylalanine--tRNA ligase subunit beta [Chitinophagaceae bacterium]